MRDLLPLQLLQKHLTFFMLFATFSTLNTRSCQSFAYSWRKKIFWMKRHFGKSFFIQLEQNNGILNVADSFSASMINI